MSQTIVAPQGGSNFLAKFNLKRGYEKRPLISMMAFIKGPVSSGKSHAIASMPRTLSIDTERKLAHVPDEFWGEGSSRFELPPSEDSFGILEDLVSSLAMAGSKGERPFDAIAFDTVDEILHTHAIPSLTERVRKVKRDAFTDYADICDFGQGGKGWSIVYGHILSLFRQLRNTGYGVWILGHEKEQRNKDGVTIYRPAVPDGLAQGIWRMAEIKGTSNLIVKSHVVEEEKVIGGRPMKTSRTVDTRVSRMTLQTKLADRDDASGNNLNLPDAIEFGRGKFWETLNTAYESR